MFVRIPEVKKRSNVVYVIDLRPEDTLFESYPDHPNLLLTIFVIFSHFVQENSRIKFAIVCDHLLENPYHQDKFPAQVNSI
jgi:hypothetical protein